MTALLEMRDLLGRYGERRGGADDDMARVLAQGHQAFLAEHHAAELEHWRRAIDPLLREPDVRRGGALTATLRTLLTSGATSAMRSRRLAEPCRRIEPPVFSVASPDETVRNDAGSVLRFSRANAGAGTLELAAATGQFGQELWPASEEFIFGLNRATASLGGELVVPPHAPGSFLTVSVHLHTEVDDFESDGFEPKDASSVVFVAPGDKGLVLRGTAIVEGRAGLTLHAPAASARTGTRFVSAWVNRDGSDAQAMRRIVMSRTVALGPETSSIAVFVDVECRAFAEESGDDRMKAAFALFEARDKSLGDVTGSAVFPARIRLTQVTARLCELPVLLTAQPRQSA